MFCIPPQLVLCLPFERYGGVEGDEGAGDFGGEPGVLINNPQKPLGAGLVGRSGKISDRVDPLLHWSDAGLRYLVAEEVELLYAQFALSHIDDQAMLAYNNIRLYY